MPSSTPGSWSDVSRLLDVLFEMSPAERVVYLDREVRDDALRREVERYLAFEQASDPVLDAPVEERRSLFERALGGLSPEATRLFKPGEAVGRYRVERLIGRGGFGEVYAAEDVEAGKRVALKVLRSTDAHVRARMRREYRLLARLDHPNVVHYMAQGETAAGVPFFVMEYVEGEPITAYCDRLRLPVEARLRLLEQVCAAVGHAHERLIIHRDLKPSNILVNARDEVRVLDLGIGKVLAEVEEDFAQTTEAEAKVSAGADASGADSGIVSAHDGMPVATLTGARQLTPSYAAPEQLCGEPVTPATDVYALGVLAFELLTGERPYDLRGLTLAEAARVVKASPIPVPSRVAGAAPTDEPATARGTSRTRLARHLRGDLDAILGKALVATPSERYPTAAALREDTQRHREHRPVQARTWLPGYQAGRFVRRNWLPLVLTVAVLAFAASAVAEIVQTRDHAEAEARRATQQRDRAEEVETFLTELLTAADPQAPSATERPDTLSARDLLDRGTRRIGRELAEEPVLQARLWGAVGKAYGRLGDYGTADSLLRLALKTVETTRPADSLALAWTQNLLATNLQAQNRYGEADSLFRFALGIRERHIRSGTPDAYLIAESQNNLGWFLADVGDLEAAAPLVQSAYETILADPNSEPWQVATMQNNLGYLLSRLDRPDEAEPLLRAAAEAREDILGEHPDLAGTYVNLGALLSRYGRYEEAVPVLRRALEIDRALLGSDHEFIADDLELLGQALTRAGQPTEALPLHREALAIREGITGPYGADVVVSLNSLALALIRLEYYEEAGLLLRRASEIGERQDGYRVAARASTYYALGQLHLAQDDAEASVRNFREALRLRREVYGVSHLLVASVEVGLAQALSLTDEPTAALPYARHADSLYAARHIPPDHPDRLKVQHIRERYGGADAP